MRTLKLRSALISIKLFLTVTCHKDGRLLSQSVKEHFQSLSSVDQIRGSETILKKVNEMVSKNEAKTKNETFVRKQFVLLTPCLVCCQQSGFPVRTNDWFS
jgi:hypothetical protein